MTGSIAILPFLAFLATHTPVTVDLQPPLPARRVTAEYGPGVKRLDPGTVNLPFGPPEAEAPVRSIKRNVVVFWIKTAPKARRNGS